MLNLFFLRLSFVAFLLAVSPVITRSQGFSESSVTLKGQKLGFASWCDVNNDGFRDIFITGTNLNSNESDFTHSILYLNNKHGNFFESSVTSIPRVIYGSADWGDFNNDGLADLLISGTTSGYPADGITKIFINSQMGQTFTPLAVNLPGVIGSQVKYFDYDNDGWQDIFIMGFDNSNHLIVKIFRNIEGNSIADSGIIFPYTPGQINNLGRTGVLIEDFDNDGDKDLIIGQNSTAGSSVDLFENTGGNFQKKNIRLPQFSYAMLASADFNNDGFLDFVIGGLNGLSAQDGFNGPGELSVVLGGPQLTFRELQNLNSQEGNYWGSVFAADLDLDGTPEIIVSGSGNGNGSDQNIILQVLATGFQPIQYMVGTHFGDATPADFDNDGDLDLLITGASGSQNETAVAKVYVNTAPAVNQRPSAPQNLSIVRDTDKTTFKWSRSHDSSTPEKSLSYNIKISTAPFGNDIKSGMNLEDGTRLINTIGNIGLDTFFILNQSANPYYWQVQAIDASYYESALSAAQPCLLSIPVTDAKALYCYNDNITITAQGTGISWYADSLLRQVISRNQFLNLTVTKNVKLYVTQSNAACSSLPLGVPINLNPPPRVDSGAHYCFRDTVVLTASGSAIKWYADQALTMLVNQGPSFKIITTTDSQFYVTENINGCASEVAISDYTVSAEPTFEVHFGDEVVTDTLRIVQCNANQSFQISAESNYAQIKWSGGDGYNLTITEDGIYRVALSDGVCMVNKDLNVIIKKQFSADIPNVITPNDDHKNDFFIVDLPAGGSASIIISNRYGEEVFQAQSYQNDFNGQNLSSGIYFYRIKSTVCDETWKGWLSIVR